MATAIDTAGGFPAAEDIRAAGHSAMVCYVSRSRPGTNFASKPLRRDVADAYRNAGVDVACVYQFGKSGDSADFRRGFGGGAADAIEANATVEACGGDMNAPIYFSIDEDISLADWNSVAVDYFRGAVSVLGQQRVGIYGHSRAIAWAVEDGVIGQSSTPGKHWAWCTRSWSNGVIAPEAVLYQRVVDTPSSPGPRVGGIVVDVNDILASDFGQWKSDSQVVDMTYYDVDWAPRFNFGGPRPVNGLRGVCVHTSEGNPNVSAEDLANYQLTSQSGSYNVIVDLTGKRLRENSDDWITWSTGNQGNNILVHICFTAQSAWTRDQWLQQEAMLRAGATVVAHWCRTYGWPVQRVDANGLPGILGHGDTRIWGGTDHTDPGPNFPYDVFLGYVRDEMAGVSSTPPPNEINIEAEVAAAWIGDRITEGENVCPDGVGRFAQFTNGYIYWHPKARDGHATAIPNHIFETYAENGWEAGLLGYPAQRHAVIEGVGDIQAFQGGVIYRRYDQPGYVIHGLIGDKWSRAGFEGGPLGWPVSNEEPYGDGTIQRFDNGSLAWSPSSVVSIPKES